MAESTRRRTAAHDEQIMVIGLGRFGGNLARELMALGHEVMGVDVDARRVQAHAAALTKAVEADSSDVDALRQLGAEQFNHVVVGVGDIEASILTVAELVGLGVRDVWAKAVSESHKRILERVGATHVVLPEHDMGRRIAHQVTGKMFEYIEIDDRFALVETGVPESLEGRTLADADVRARYDVTVVFVKPPEADFTYAQPDSLLERGALLMVAGDRDAVERFASESR